MSDRLALRIRSRDKQSTSAKELAAGSTKDTKISGSKQTRGGNSPPTARLVRVQVHNQRSNRIRRSPLAHFAFALQLDILVQMVGDIQAQYATQ